jgi:hypothetical protein
MENEFERAAEESKMGFQANICSLIELHGHLQGKYINSQRNKKEGVFIPNEEMEEILKWILDISGETLAHYIAIDGVNRKTNKLFKCALKLQDRQPQTPSLKKMLA